LLADLGGRQIAEGIVGSQGDIVQDYYLMRNGYRPHWPGHGISEYEAILPFGR